MAFDAESLTLNEVATVEDLSGQSLNAFENEDAPKGKLLAALVFVLKRREGTAPKWNECLNMTAVEATAYLGINDAETGQVEEVTTQGDPDPVHAYVPPEGDSGN